MDQDVKPNSRGDYFGAIFLVALFIAGFYIYSKIASPSSQLTIPNNTPTSSVDISVTTSTINPGQQATSPVSLTDWQLFNSYKKVKIYPKGIETPSDYVQNASQALSNAGRKIKIIGSIVDAYIYIKAGANDGKGNFSSIDPQYDGIWFYRKDGGFDGGLLDLSQSRRGAATENTEVLYNLKYVPIALNNQAYRQNNFKSIDVLSRLVDSSYLAALVSTSRYGRIDDFEIGYKCASSTPNCSISAS